MNFGDILKKLRQDKKMTQEELAIKINSSRSNIANYENNNNMPSVEILDRLAKIFDVSTDYMLGKTNIKNNKLDLTDEDIKFIKSIKKLDNTNKMIIENTMEALLDKQEKDEKKGGLTNEIWTTKNKHKEKSKSQNNWKTKKKNEKSY